MSDPKGDFCLADVMAALNAIKDGQTDLKANQEDLKANQDKTNAQLIELNDIIKTSISEVRVFRGEIKATCTELREEIKDELEVDEKTKMANKLDEIDDLSRHLQEQENESEEDAIRLKEQSILKLGETYKKESKAKELAELIRQTRLFLCTISKAKAAKLVRSLVDVFLDLEASIGGKVQLCKECIESAKQEKKTILWQYLEACLIALYFDTGMFTEALHLGSTLLRELNKFDDKKLLLEVQLLESKTYHALSNLPKARAALTSARTTANSIYCPPKLQASLDMQSGILHAADERDFKTAYSYFCEAFEGYDSVESSKALTALKYMLLSKIMLNTPKDVQKIISEKLALKYAGSAIEAMKCVAQASLKRSLVDFQEAVDKSKEELENDPIVRAHLDSLHDTVLEQNLCQIIEPYSRVQVDYVSKCINIPVNQVGKKLSQMILDKKFHVIQDQGEVVFPQSVSNVQLKDTIRKGTKLKLKQINKTVFTNCPGARRKVTTHPKHVRKRTFRQRCLKLWRRKFSLEAFHAYSSHICTLTVIACLIMHRTHVRRRCHDDVMKLKLTSNL